MNSKISNPAVFTLLGFGFGVAVLGVQQLMPGSPQLVAAAVYATLVAAIAEFIGGCWAFARGDTYLGSIGATFGAWLVGYYLLVTAGVAAGMYHPASAGLYCFALIIPVVIMMLPAVRLRLVAFTGVFVFLVLLLLFLGLAGMPIAGTGVFQRLGGVCALITAALLWWSALGATKQMLADMVSPPRPGSGATS